MSAPCWWRQTTSFSGAFCFDAAPLAGCAVEAPEIIVVVERPLFGARELAAKEPEGAGATAVLRGGDEVAGTGEGGVGGGDLAPV